MPAEARTCAVGDDAHQRVGDRVAELGAQHDDPGLRSRQSLDLGQERDEEQADDIERAVRQKHRPIIMDHGRQRGFERGIEAEKAQHAVPGALLLRHTFFPVQTFATINGYLPNASSMDAY